MEVFEASVKTWVEISDIFIYLFYQLIKNSKIGIIMLDDELAVRKNSLALDKNTFKEKINIRRDVIVKIQIIFWLLYINFCYHL